MATGRWVHDGPQQDYRTSPRGLLDLILVHTRPGFNELSPFEREAESHRCYRLLPEHRRTQLGQLSRMLRSHPVQAMTSRELALLRFAWRFAFHNNPTLRRPPVRPRAVPVQHPRIRRVVPEHLIPEELRAYLRGGPPPTAQAVSPVEQRPAAQPPIVQVESSTQVEVMPHVEGARPVPGRGHGRRVVYRDFSQ